MIRIMKSINSLEYDSGYVLWLHGGSVPSFLFSRENIHHKLRPGRKAGLGKKLSIKADNC